MNAIFFSPKYEAHGNKILGMTKERFPAEQTRTFHTLSSLKASLGRGHAPSMAVVIVDDEKELIELGLQPVLPPNVAIVVILPDRNEGLLRVATAVSPALIWFDDNSVDDLMSIIVRIKLEQKLSREDLQGLELSWSDDYPYATNFFWYSMKSYSQRIQSLSEIAYYA